MKRALAVLISWLALAGGAACALAALAGQLGRWSESFDLFNHLSPVWLAGGLFAIGLCLFASHGRSRRLGLAFGAVAVLATGLQTVPVLARAAGQAAAARAIPADAPRLKLIQFSFYHANPTPNGAVSWLLAQNADVIVLEEGEGLRGPARDRLLAAYPYRSGDDAFILSRWPMRGQGGFEQPPRPTAMYFNGAYAVIDGPGGPFTLTGVHFTWPWPVRFQARQRRVFARYLQTLAPDSTIMAGDLNSTPWSFALQRFSQNTGLTLVTNGMPTFPARTYHGDGKMHRVREVPGLFAIAPIDQILVGSAWKPVSVRRGPKLGSDHYPVVAVLARVG